MDIEIITGTSDQQAADYERIEQAIRFLEKHYQDQPPLKDIAAALGLSEFHFQRLFSQWVGISPKRFLQYLTKEHAKALLARSEDLMAVAYDSGLSGPGRLHDLFVATEAVTPGEYKLLGEGLVIQYGFHPTPFGRCLLARTARGICHLAFVEAGQEQLALQDLRARWRSASFEENLAATRPLANQAFLPRWSLDRPLSVYLQGTNFQIKVWEALLRIPSGSVVTYHDLAVSIGMPGAARAVGHALGQNPIAVLIPCHRVIRRDGDFGNYHYGSARKKALLGWEFAQQEQLAGYSI
ncbi:MAG TPA: methylated-DNA--[protein]-cysteine S-methyltransferase [Anaerolineaceae bacterium]|jgi:AraC family transcriptional regulator of adaptative response/methylated-DNA-[protein]-cysteine methyltransferase